MLLCLLDVPALHSGSACTIVVAGCAKVAALVHVQFVQLRGWRLHILRLPEGQLVSRLPLPGLPICL